ncbi:MAG: AAA family ATPase [Candidatus Poseidoniales archaeon]|nr:MAG: AAA family ATPase [Candidatus Poseidoniales archaeon]
MKVDEPSKPCSFMGQASDWTERHRPRSEQLLEGNEVQRRKIRSWLDEWQNGSPKKKALLLIGPPGVGKTTVARAIAEDMGWNVIELNASDARNAAAIRKAATSGATHRSLFHDPTAPPSRTLILLDEVDHLSGGLRQISQERIEKAMTGDDERPGSTLKGDSGGKAELLRLLDQTKQPVILACNEEMGLWGRNSSWRNTRDRFTKHLLKINFVRANDEALRRIARRVLREEGIEFEEAAIDALARTNHGDLRALVRDLQVLTTGLNGEALTPAMVNAHAEASQRDVNVEIFPGLDRLYRERNSEVAAALIRTIDKDPSEFLNWVHWNNASLFTDSPSVRRGTRTLLQADRAMMGRFLNTAHRSTYWTQHLTALAASTANAVPLEGRIFPSYPNYLRRRAPAGRSSIVEKLAEVCGTNQSTTREEFLQPLFALMQDDQPLGNSSDFDISLGLGLSGEEHLSLAGLAKTRRSSKALVKAYEEAEDVHKEALMMRLEEERSKALTSEPKPQQEPRESVIEQPEDEETQDDDKGPSPGQMTLF